MASSTSKTDEKNADGIAPKVGDAADGGQPGTIKPMPAADKPDPSTIAHVQVLDDERQ